MSWEIEWPNNYNKKSDKDKLGSLYNLMGDWGGLRSDEIYDELVTILADTVDEATLKDIRLQMEEVLKVCAGEG